MDLLNQIICSEAKTALSSIGSQTIDLVVTSPPYDNIRKYQGYSFDFEGIALELKRVLKPGGVIVWVVGDQTIKGSESGNSFKQALYFKEIGLNLYDTMIYAKNNPIPLNHRRYEQVFEYIFVVSKGIPKTFNPIMIPCKYAGQVDKRQGRDTSAAQEMGAMKPFSEERTYVYKDEKIHGNIFYYSIGQNQSTKDKIAFKHPAIMPETLAKDMITTWSNEGDVVLDPFVGSGTTVKWAKILKRPYIGIDLSEEYCQITQERLDATSS